MHIAELAELMEDRGRLTFSGNNVSLYVLTDEFTANSIKGLTGTGRIYTLKDSYKVRWNVSRVPDVFHIVQALRPYFTTSKWEYELGMLEHRLNLITSGRQISTTTLQPTPHLEIPPKTLKRMQRIIENAKNKGKVINAKRAKVVGTQERMEMFQRYLGGMVHVHKPTKDWNEETGFLATWITTRRPEIRRFAEVFGLTEAQ